MLTEHEKEIVAASTGWSFAGKVTMTVVSVLALPAVGMIAYAGSLDNQVTQNTQQIERMEDHLEKMREQLTQLMTSVAVIDDRSARIAEDMSGVRQYLRDSAADGKKKSEFD